MSVTTEVRRNSDFPEFESYSEGLIGHEFKQVEGILTQRGESYRIRVQERDEGIYADIWEGENNDGYFDPGQYVASSYEEGLVPETEKDLGELTDSLFGDELV